MESEMANSDSTLPKQVSVYPVDFPKNDPCCVSPFEPPYPPGP